jgi:hypothetical protein
MSVKDGPKVGGRMEGAAEMCKNSNGFINVGLCNHNQGYENEGIKGIGKATVAYKIRIFFHKTGASKFCESLKCFKNFAIMICNSTCNYKQIQLINT